MKQKEKIAKLRELVEDYAQATYELAMSRERDYYECVERKEKIAIRARKAYIRYLNEHFAVGAV